MKPIIAITMGDPAGIGPEVILKALSDSFIRDCLTAVVIGDEAVLRKAASALSLPYKLKPWEAPDAGRKGEAAAAYIYHVDTELADHSWGEISEANGSASCRYIEKAVEEALAGKFDAICTAPISKEAIKLAGNNFPGHTEMLQSLIGSKTVRMMLAGGGLQVVLQTIHVALKDVPSLITIESVLESLRIIHDYSKMVGDVTTSVGICGLNPHAGEAGHFGTEEIEVLIPAVEQSKAQGQNVTGPVPGDTIFFRALQGEFRYVLAMYHDQALIPVKTLDFHGGVNVTLGLPIIRTSPDHGTAFNIAGRGIANQGSMIAAINYAAELALARQKRV